MSSSPTRQLPLTRGKSRDFVTFGLPSLPERIALYNAKQAALGWMPGDEKPSQPPSPDDLLAVQWAAVGLCVRTGLGALELPRLRDHRRDVVAFGEAVATVLWDGGYQDLREVLDAGAELVKWVQAETWKEASAVAAEAEGFPKAPEPATGPGAR